MPDQGRHEVMVAETFVTVRAIVFAPRSRTCARPRPAMESGKHVCRQRDLPPSIPPLIVVAGGHGRAHELRQGGDVRVRRGARRQGRGAFALLCTYLFHRVRTYVRIHACMSWCAP